MAWPLFFNIMEFFRNMESTLRKLNLLCHSIYIMSQAFEECHPDEYEHDDDKRVPFFDDCHALSSDDARLVMEKLGMWSSDEGVERRCTRFLEDVFPLLEEKEASLGELEEAFGIFDEDRDGFVCVEELQRVMMRLGMEEGMRLEDCRRMVIAFDENGDGKIDFNEFRNLLESTP